MKRKQNLLWITDPWNTLDHIRDTTLRFAQEAQTMGISSLWCDVRSIRMENEKILLNAERLQFSGSDRNPESIKRGKSQVYSPKDFSQIHYRTDPPVDHAYTHPLELLSLALRGVKTCEMVNPFDVLYSMNEKMEASAIPSLTPPSLISSDWDRLSSFGQSQGETVLKPLYLAQSLGIELLKWKTQEQQAHAKEKIFAATQGFRSPILLQKYLKGIAEGEIRLWFVDGKLLSIAKKHPLAGDFRVNLDLGSQVGPAELTSHEKKQATKIARHLKARKIRLAAVDLIDGYATDFNFTSPGLIVQMESISGENLSRQVLNAIAG